MRSSESRFVPVRGIDLHCRLWGPENAPVLFLLHGSQDGSASWQFTVDALRGEWRVVAPDWRGYGLSGWSGADSYWFVDYLGDLDALADLFSPHQPLQLVERDPLAHRQGEERDHLGRARPDDLPGRQGHHVRLGRHLDQAGRADG